MRDRLIELIGKSFAEESEKRLVITAQYTADYLLASGVIVPPCKVGDKVYRISSRTPRTLFIEETTISRIAIDNEGVWVFCTCNPISRRVFGKTVVLTREEAEQALKGGVE